MLDLLTGVAIIGRGAVYIRNQVQFSCDMANHATSAHSNPSVSKDSEVIAMQPSRKHRLPLIKPNIRDSPPDNSSRY